MISLSKRLKTIFGMVPHQIIADVGADHGKLVIALVECKKINKAYAIENKKGPFERLIKEIEKANFSDKIIPLFSDGISILPDDVKTLVLAGMGGINIINIINSHLENLKNVDTIIVDAHTLTSKVREFICSIGFIIADEKIVYEENVYYEIIKFIRATQAIYSSEDFEFGPILRERKEMLFIQKYETRIKEIDFMLQTKQIPSYKLMEFIKEKERIQNQLCKRN